ncbi:MAG: hypothetical protein HWN67_09910 [Candidatus Helarchaeota archaeon]|nr:hypothetical protein [Candidatus Helarchaeota archaeon]
MEIIELKPIKDKIIILYLIDHKNFLWSKREEMKINYLLSKYDFKFISFDLKSEDFNKNSYNSLIKKLRNSMKPYFILDIPKDEKKELLYEITRYDEQIEEIIFEYKLFNNTELDKRKLKTQKFKSWIEYLKTEVKEKEYLLNSKIKPRWIVKGLLDLIDLYNEEIMYILHFTSEDVFTELRNILKRHKITVISYDIREEMEKREAYSTSQEIIK